MTNDKLLAIANTMCYFGEKLKYPKTNCNYLLQNLDLKEVAQIICNANLSTLYISIAMSSQDYFIGLEAELVKKVTKLQNWINN